MSVGDETETEWCPKHHVSTDRPCREPSTTEIAARDAALDAAHLRREGRHE